jgi:uncharacterized membrane protein
MNEMMSLKTRYLHALSFEIGAVLLCTPLMGWLFDLSLLHTGTLAVIMSLIALLWNVVFNAAFDHYLMKTGKRKTISMRVQHTVLFEGGLVVLLVPLSVWWLSIGWWEALRLDMVILLFFIPYTFCFNWIFDVLYQCMSRGCSKADW